MAQQKKGLITRLLEGKEKSEEYARSTLPTNRWQLFWDIFKGNFGKIVKVNLLILLFFIPLAIVIFAGSVYAESVGITYPFGANLAIGYPAMPSLQGQSEWLSVQGDFFMYIGVLLASIVAAVGLSGGMYVIRNMVWTEVFTQSKHRLIDADRLFGQNPEQSRIANALTLIQQSCSFFVTLV